jgi:hypothetical protein
VCCPFGKTAVHFDDSARNGIAGGIINGYAKLEARAIGCGGFCPVDLAE